LRSTMICGMEVPGMAHEWGLAAPFSFLAIRWRMAV
jgi:hypothetical protein